MFYFGLLWAAVKFKQGTSQAKALSFGVRLALRGVAIGSAFIPVIGWGVSIGIGAADLIWGDEFYERIDKH